MTYRELINQVLIRLREDTVASDWSGAINDSSTVNDYQKVIGSLINDAKRSIESYHDWLVLRETVNVSTVASTKNYNLSSGQEFKVLDVTNNSTGNSLSPVTQHYINSIKYPTDPTGEPSYYAFNGADSSNNLKISNFEEVLNQTDLVYDFNISKFDKDYIYYKVIFNGTPNIFLKDMKKKKYKIDTRNKIWVIK